MELMNQVKMLYWAQFLNSMHHQSYEGANGEGKNKNRKGGVCYGDDTLESERVVVGSIPGNGATAA